jgi:hypothetical protein
VIYRIDWTRVANEIEPLSARVRRSWDACLEEIATDPRARFGAYVEPAIPLNRVPMRTWVYEIAAETSISDEELYVFTGDFLPEFAPVYVIDEDQREVVIIYLRQNRRA